jgi:hypothetical protein
MRRNETKARNGTSSTYALTTTASILSLPLLAHMTPVGQMEAAAAMQTNPSAIKAAAGRLKWMVVMACMQQQQQEEKKTCA